MAKIVKNTYRIGIIPIKGSVYSIDASGDDDMELKVLTIMDKGNYKKIIAQNVKTKERKTWYKK